MAVLGIGPSECLQPDKIRDHAERSWWMRRSGDCETDREAARL